MNRHICVTAQNVTETLHENPYETTVVHKLYITNCDARLNYLNWCLHGVYGGEIGDSILLLFSVEAWFHLNECVNSQSNRHWSAENPKCRYMILLCAVGAARITGGPFFVRHHKFIPICNIYSDFIFCTPVQLHKALCHFSLS